MRSAFVLLAILTPLAGATTFQVSNTAPAAWEKLFASIGVEETLSTSPSIIVAGPTAHIDVSVSERHILILEGFGPAAHDLGFTEKPGAPAISIRQICDAHAPQMQIFWEQPEAVPEIQIPDGFQVFATEKWKHAPVLAGKRTAHGAILWLATDPGPSGFERYPYLLHALVDLGLALPLRANNVWAFFDSSYRIRADVDYLARRWRESGIGVLHVAAWHNVEPEPTQDAYLKRLIEACHRNSILVYAWLELTM
jgi:hypothetical protein